jgi:hypothetical protein
MSGGKNESMLKAAPLWTKSSAKGGQYLTGRLGGVKVLILENRDRQNNDEPSHHLFFVEAQPRQGAQDRGDGQKGAQGEEMPPTRQRPSQPQRSGFQGHADGDRDGGPEWER